MREKIEGFFDQWGRVCAQHPVSVLLLMLLLSAILMSALPPRIDTTMEGFLRQDSPAIKRYNQLRDDFGRDEMMVTTVTTNDIFAPAFIERLQRLEQDIWQRVPWMDDLILLTNVRAIYADGDDVRIEGLFERWPDETELNDIKARAVNNPLYEKFVLSEDMHTTAIIVRLQNSYLNPASGELENLGETQFAEAATGMQDAMQAFSAAGDRVAVAGTPVVITELQKAMQRDMGVFTLLTLTFVGTMLWLMFRRGSVVLMSLLVVGLAATGTLGLLALTNTPLQMPLVILPSFLIAVGIGDSVHFLSTFIQKLRTQKNVHDAIRASMRHTGLAMLLTSITTAASLLSFAGSDILPLSSLGWAAAAGVMLAWLYTITLIPALLSLWQRTFHAGEAAAPLRGHRLMLAFTDRCVALAVQYPWRVMLLCGALAVGGAWQASQLHFSHHPLEWLPKDWPIRQATDVIDTRLSGSMNIEILLDSGEQDGWKNAQRIKALAELSDALDQEKFTVTVRKVQSLSDMLREINQALHNGNPEQYVTPSDDDLLAQELFLLELSAANDLYRRVDRDYRTTRITLSVPWVDTLYYAAMTQQIEQLAAQHVPADIDVNVTGLVAVLSRTLAAVIVDTARSYMIAFVVIAVMMILLLGRIKLGLLAMIPNLLPILLALGFMHAVGIPLDMFSMLVGAIAIGLAVDDTIHFMHHYEANRQRGNNVSDAIYATLHESGRAMLTTSIILAGGFLIFIFSEMNNLTGFGLVTAFTVMAALLADFILAPALMVLTDKRGSLTTEISSS
jgi:predicted RND superfamily exporter protein